MRRGMRRRNPGQVDEVGPVLSEHLVAPFARSDHAVVVAHQRRELELAVVDGAFGQYPRRQAFGGRGIDIVSDVELAPADLRQHVVAHAVAEEDFGLLRGSGEASHERAQPDRLGIQDRADTQRCPLRFPQGIRRRPEIRRGRYRPVRQRQQGGARFGQGKAARRPVEKQQAGALFQPLQLEADGGLGQMQQGGRARNRAFAGHGDEAAQGLDTWQVVHLENL